MDKAAIFKGNLRRLAYIRQVSTAKQLASALAFTSDDRKWLNRLWNEGITRPDPRRRKAMSKLKTFLGIGKGQNLWTPQVIGEVLDHRRIEVFGENGDEYVYAIEPFSGDLRFIEVIVKLHSKLLTMKQRDPIAYSKAMQHYGDSESFLISEWIRISGSLTLLAETEDVFFDDYILAMFQISELQLKAKNLFQHLNEVFKDHPEWLKYLQRLKSHVEEQVGSSGDIREIQRLVVEAIQTIILGYLNHRPTLNDVLEIFESLVLRYSDTTISGFDAVLFRLRQHPNWKEWAKRKGGEVNCIINLHSQRRTTNLQGEFPVESFVEYYTQELDGCLPEAKSAPKFEFEEGFSVRKRRTNQKGTWDEK